MINTLKNFLRTYWKTLLFFLLVGLFGGFFTGLYMLDSYPADMQQELINQGATPVLLGAVTAVQSAGYGVILGAIGILISKKLGLWKDENNITKRPLLSAIGIGVFGGLAIILPDLLFFGKYIGPLKDSYAIKPTIPYILAAVTYGAVIEEIMLRLFFMSLIALILHTIFTRRQEKPSVPVLIAAKFISALLFAAGHLPATFMLLGNTPMILFRCFLLNGGIGLLFGRLFRKYGLRYAMIAHGGAHIVSKLIWILFL